jgi:hypothetical protein
VNKTEYKQERIKVMNVIKSWIQEKIDQTRSLIIVMGDFNMNLDKYHEFNEKQKSIPWNFQLIHYLNNKNFADTVKISNINEKYTWTQNRQDKEIKVRIDNIWISSDILNEIQKVYLDQAEFGTDHRTIVIHIDNKKFERHLASLEANRNGNSREIFYYDNMNKEKWEEYKQEIENLIEEKQIMNKILDDTNGDKINSIWENIRYIIREAADLHIDKRTIYDHEGYSENRLVTKIYKIIKFVTNRIKKIKKDKKVTYEIREEILTTLEQFKKKDEIFENINDNDIKITFNWHVPPIDRTIKDLNKIKK